MSTFDGHVAEFPFIRIDRFRDTCDAIPPLAFFVSHVHTDHLVGLESCRKIFVYCSPATREILLRLEKYPHRMNFSRGILEVRKQTYRRLATLIKAIPLYTPTELELSPAHTIRVTLLEANHCVGAVMFLIEGSGKAILYTGDVRSEAWLVNAICRNPVIIPYVRTSTRRALKVLDNVYLDTSYVADGSEKAHKHFPSKQEGISELLDKVHKYPPDTVFYFDAWTFGYEEVWQALVNLLDVQVHLDDYRFGLYAALVNGSEPKAHEAHQLCGYLCGNHLQKGILTRNYTRLHSCERGTGCKILDADIVRITPILSRYQGIELNELGIGGGLGDLDQHHELDLAAPGIIYQLMGYCSVRLQAQPELKPVLEMLQQMLDSHTAVVNINKSKLAPDSSDRPDQNDQILHEQADNLPLERLLPALIELSQTNSRKSGMSKPKGRKGCDATPEKTRPDGLPSRITFPYSRHSSYDELCVLIDALRPKEITPCTVIEVDWHQGRSMRNLFGHLYDSSTTFKHDNLMQARVKLSRRPRSRSISPQSQNQDRNMISTPEPKRLRQQREPAANEVLSTDPPSDAVSENSVQVEKAKDFPIDLPPSSVQISSASSKVYRPDKSSLLIQQDAYEAALGIQGKQWSDIELVSTRKGPYLAEMEL